MYSNPFNPLDNKFTGISLSLFTFIACTSATVKLKSTCTPNLTFITVSFGIATLDSISNCFITDLSIFPSKCGVTEKRVSLSRKYSLPFIVYVIIVSSILP